MQSTPLSDQRALLVYAPGDPAVETLQRFAADRKIASAFFQAIGGFESATIAYWNREAKEYEEIGVGEQVEVLSMLGTITRSGDGWKTHAHVVLGRRDGSTIGGHLREGVVYPTLEVVVTMSATVVMRKKDAETQLELIAIDR